MTDRLTDEQLREWRDSLMGNRAEISTHQLDLLINELLAHRARVAHLEMALRPFAKAANNFDRMPIKNPTAWFAYGGLSHNDGVDGAITVADLREARAALAQSAESGSR